MSLRYDGCANFRARLTVSTLSGKPLKISHIREQDIESGGSIVGLQDYEANYLKLLESLSDGCTIEVNETGTQLYYRPGLLIGGTITHNCGTSKSIGWFIEGILPLALLCKSPVKLILTGITNDSQDFTVDVLRHVTIPLLKHFIDCNLPTIEVKTRGCAPKGGGSVVFTCPVVKSILPIYNIHSGKVRRVRGTIFCAKISPTIITRVIDSVKSVLGGIISDVYIESDHTKGKESGLSAGYSVCLVAESTTGNKLSIERTAGQYADNGAELPENIGQDAALMLLDEISTGGVVDRSHQSLVLLLMALGPEDVCKVRFGELTKNSIEILRLLKDAYGIVFKIKVDSEDTIPNDIPDDISDEGSQNMDDENNNPDSSNNLIDGLGNVGVNSRKYTNEKNTVLLSCLGIGYINMSRRIR
eukprot:gene20430-26511_t